MLESRSTSLDDLLAHALREGVIDAYDDRGICVVIECDGRTYTSSRSYAHALILERLPPDRRTPPNAS